LEKATLRPVPLRPPGPVDPAEAAAHVAAALPELDEAAARALALVEIAGQSRSEVASAIAIAPEALAVALTRARKALRRTIFPLSASGWCERAERMISDRIDGELRAPGPRRLQVHLENCDRCLEHDRRLAQARDQLVREFIDAHPHADVAPLAERAAAGLRVVRPTLVEAPPVPPGPVVPSFGGPAPDPVTDSDPPAPTFAGPDDGWTPPPVERREAPAAPAEPVAAEAPAPVAAEAPEPVAPVPTPVPTPALLLWNALYGVAVLFAILTIVLLVLALAGVERVI